MNQIKPLSELNLLNRFLFAETIKDPDNQKILLEIVLGEDITLKGKPEPEKELRVFPDLRAARLDVIAWDEQDRVFNTEVQKENTLNLPKRTRYYSSMIDVNLLKPGDVDFNKLPESFIIMFMPFDLFGKDRCMYTFTQTCRQDSSLHLQDGTTRIFLNTHGTNREGVSDELFELLRYMEFTTSDVASESKKH